MERHRKREKYGETEKEREIGRDSEGERNGERQRRREKYGETEKEREIERNRERQRRREK